MPADRRFSTTLVRTLTAPADAPMHLPTAVALDSQGRAFVADGVRNRVLRFRADGDFDTALVKFGDQTLLQPVGLTIDHRDRLWIADTRNHRVIVATTEGALVETIALPERPAEPTASATSPNRQITTSPHLPDPTDLVVTPDGQRTYVVDNDGHRLLIRDNAAGTWQTLGEPGRGLGQFQWPFMICIGPDGYVAVTEAIGARVQRVSPRDQWAGQIGRWGIELGELYRPKGIAADRHGRLFVSDSTLGVVQVFNPRGGCDGVLTQSDGRPYRFEHPMGLAFDAAGLLHVVELTANRVAVVRVEDPAPAPPTPAASRPATQPAPAPATQPATASAAGGRP